MKAMEAVKGAAKAGGVTYSAIGDAMGKRPNYVSVAINKGLTPQADTLAAMLAPCGYSLAAVPTDELPPSALVIDPPPKDDQ